MGVPITHVPTRRQPPPIVTSSAQIAPLPRIPADTPELLVALPDGRQATLPGMLWSVPGGRSPRDALGGEPPLQISQVKRREANRLLRAWQHELGEYRRPFAEQHFTLDVAGVPVAVASSGSIVSTTLEGHRRRRVVELARIARHPDHPHALRAMLRLWRAYLVDCWPVRYWPVDLAVAYALPGKTGDLYRFDGWRRVGPRKRSGGGGTWSSNAPRVNAIADGIKTLWVYDYQRALHAA